MSTPIEFENFVGRYFQQKGYRMTNTPVSGDYGVDLFVENDLHKLAIQVKMYGGTTGKVNRKCIMELYGAKAYFDCNEAILVTNGDVLVDALEVANKLKIEILNLAFTCTTEASEVNLNSFESIWKNYIFPLKNKELTREDGKKNIIVDVNWGGIKRLTSNSKLNTIDIEIFREAYKILTQHGSISMDYINQNYPGRASSGVILILSQLPFLELRRNPVSLYLRKSNL